MYLVTSMISNSAINGIQVQSEEAINEVASVMKLIFTPINSIILLASLGNVFGKVKDKVIRNRQSRNKNYDNTNCICNCYYDRIKLYE